MNGLIVCLDQEKAYNQILHIFLWASLKRFRLPPEFVRTVKALYKDVYTRIILNGEISKSFRVTRGVRQGDSLLCLLFDITIESLAQMLHNSKLEGICLSEDLKRLIATLFADNVTVYLASNDKFLDLEEILKKWCQASGAKFNIPKTVIVLVGSHKYRKIVISMRKPTPDSPLIPEEIKIAKEGKATHLLGAFIGNGVDNASVWTPTLEVVVRDLKRWEKSNPTIEGCRLGVRMVVGRRTQYRARVQDMPKQVEEYLEKMIRSFLLKTESKLMIGMNTMKLPIEEGGRKVLDIKTRNKAIEIMKVQ